MAPSSFPMAGIETTPSSNALSVSSSLGPVYIAGFVLVGVVLIALFTVICVRISRKRALERKGAAPVAASPSIQDTVKTEHEKIVSQHDERKQAARGSTSSGQSTTPKLNLADLPYTLPELPALSTPKDIIDFHRESGNFPRPFTFALNATSNSSPRSSLLNPNSAGKRTSTAPPPSPTLVRQSFSSNRFSVISTCSTISLQANGTSRKVHQIFTPVLPDELLITRVGERLTVVQTFDDGWCVVGRESPFKIPSGPKSLFKPDTPESNIELGVVPAWCFIKAVKGLRAERPVRSSSLGITVNMQGPEFSSRDQVMSWSNF